jgi:two-component system chemotaxis response regulator CheY
LSDHPKKNTATGENAMRLLIVDDSNMIRTRISRVVQNGGLKGVVLAGLAKNGREALRLARATRPEVVTMDLTMPEMDGIECIQEMLKFDPSINILVVSALSDKSTAIEALKLGARGFVAKPFSDEELQIALLDVSEMR